MQHLAIDILKIACKGPVPLPKTHESREKNGQDLVVRDC